MHVVLSRGHAYAPLRPAPRTRSSDTDCAADIIYNPQDPVVMPALPTRIDSVGPGPSVPRARLEGVKLAPVNGRYVYDETDPNYHVALPFAAAAKTIATFERALGQPIRWAFWTANTEKLGIVPDEGEDLNAFYSRDDANLNFFHFTDPKTGTTIYSGDSGEVVSHETSHAILDSLRPGYSDSFSPDPAAFHEAFGDVGALIMSLHDERVLDKLVEQTGGDLSKPNIIAAMGEQIGTTINDTFGRNVTGGDYTRNALNNFKWADPSTLPDKGGPDELGSEEHSFSRLWTGATYDILKGIVDARLHSGLAPKEALRAGGDELLKIYVNLFQTASSGDFTFRDMAQAMIESDKQFNSGKNADLMTEVFTNRNIIGNVGFQSTPRHARVEFTSQSSAPGTVNIRVALNGKEYGVFDGAVVETPIDTDGSLTKSAEVGARVQDNLKRLIKAGRIKYTSPDQNVKKGDLLDSQGRPYMGIVRWLDGHMRIERVKIFD